MADEIDEPICLSFWEQEADGGADGATSPVGDRVVAAIVP
jgi:hypothetical protein